jgi:hypothetical protein
VTYINLAQNRKANPIIHHTKLLNLIITAGILAAKLIAGKSNDFKVLGVLGFELLVQFLQPFELWREAAFRRRVHDQDDFAVELR